MDGSYKEKDRLTGILTREYFDASAKEIIDDNPDIDFTIIEIDINRLNVINELYGVSEGDNVLKYMGSTLEEVFESVPFSIYARLQADLFVILCPDDNIKIGTYIEEIEQKFKEYSRILNIDILLSFGVYECIERGVALQILRDRAKLALKTVKGNYIQHVNYYDSSMYDRMAGEQEIVLNMNSALKNREFEVYFQPKHSLDDDRIIGAEALVRWISPDRGMISPGVFIPIFEENGFIMKLDQYVWEETCSFIHEQMEAGVNIMPVSVNISRINIYNPELVDIFSHLVTKYNIPSEMLELEFTESAYVDNPQLMLQIMEQLHALGFKIEMDDFGAGYSSLNMLKDVPVDVLKIDLNFLSKTSHPDKAFTIMSSVIRMAKWLGINSIVEGVETEEQIEFLKSIGATSVQGYFYSKPIPAEDFVEYIKKYDVKTGPAKKEELHSSVKVLEINKVWDMISSTRSEEFPIFDTFGLYEYHDKHIEIVRVPDSYFRVLHTDREKQYKITDSIEDNIFPEDVELLHDMFEKASTGHHMSQGIFRRKTDDGLMYLYAKVRLLGINSTGNSKMFYMGIIDMSDTIRRLGLTN